MIEHDEEEVVPKNSVLYNYLQETGYHAVATTDMNESEIPPSAVHTYDVTRIDNYDLYTDEFGGLEHQVNVILNSSLVFEEDATVVKNFILPSDRLSRSPCINRLSITALLTTLVGGMSAILFTSGYKRCILYSALCWTPVAYQGIRGVYRRYFLSYTYRRKILHLTDVLQRFSVLVHKCIQYIQDCEIIMRDSPSIKKKLNIITEIMGPNVVSKFACENERMMLNLRVVLVGSLHRMIRQLRTSVHRLIESFPLNRIAEKRECYLSFLTEEHLGIRDVEFSTRSLQKLKCTHLLLQSELLKRLALCFNRKLWNTEPSPSMKLLFQMTDAVSSKASHEFRILDDEYQTYYMFGGYKPTKEDGGHYKRDWKLRDLYEASRSLSSNIQALLTQSRCLQDDLLEHSRNSNEDISISVRMDDMLNRFETCKQIFENLKHQAYSLKPKNAEKEEGNLGNLQPTQSAGKSVVFPVYRSDFTPSGSDEVYVGKALHEMGKRDISDEYVVNEGCNAYSKHLIKELKVALKGKQAEWKYREEEALKNQNMQDLSSDFEEEEEHKDEVVSALHIPESVLPLCSSQIGLSIADEAANLSIKWGLNREENFGCSSSEEET